MPTDYQQRISNLIATLDLGIDVDIEVSGRAPTMASSEFLTNKEQGDWAEKLVLAAINQSNTGLFALEYGRADALAAGDEGFADFYADYQAELNDIGKRPDILIFDSNTHSPDDIDTSDDNIVCQAIAAIEVRSSSFLADRYAQHMTHRSDEALRRCRDIQQSIFSSDLGDLLHSKNPTLHDFLRGADDDTFKQLDFRRPNWQASEALRKLSNLLRDLKTQIETLHKRDYLSITPKVEDIALVNRWIQRFGVRHFYLQVFFDKAYLIPFEQILEIASTPDMEGDLFSVERDIKNQGKTTVKINIRAGREVIGRIDMPDHQSRMKELDRGRLLFYVSFQGGRGYIDEAVLRESLGV